MLQILSFNFVDTNVNVFVDLFYNIDIATGQLAIYMHKKCFETKCNLYCDIITTYCDVVLQDISHKNMLWHYCE